MTKPKTKKTELNFICACNICSHLRNVLSLKDKQTVNRNYIPAETRMMPELRKINKTVGKILPATTMISTACRKQDKQTDPLDNMPLIEREQDKPQECKCCCHLWCCIEAGKHQTECQHCLVEYGSYALTPIIKLISQVEAQAQQSTREQIIKELEGLRRKPVRISDHDRGFEDGHEQALDDAIAVIQRGKDA